MNDIFLASFLQDMLMILHLYPYSQEEKEEIIKIVGGLIKATYDRNQLIDVSTTLSAFFFIFENLIYFYRVRNLCAKIYVPNLCQIYVSITIWQDLCREIYVPKSMYQIYVPKLCTKSMCQSYVPNLCAKSMYQILCAKSTYQYLCGKTYVGKSMCQSQCAKVIFCFFQQAKEFIDALVDSNSMLLRGLEYRIDEITNEGYQRVKIINLIQKITAKSC